jgi:Na+/H+-dicarboxylate symporter
MCQENKSCKRFFNPTILFVLAIVLGVCCGWVHVPVIYTIATMISQAFISILKLVSLPIIFLSLVSTASGMDSVHEIKALGGKVIKYTLLTTVVAAVIALFVFLVINPVRVVEAVQNGDVQQAVNGSYLQHLLQVIPDNLVKPFLENNVIGVLMIALFLSLAIIALPHQNRHVLHSLFSSLFAAVMKITSWIVLLMPLAIWAFITLFMRDLHAGLEFQSLALYLVCVLLANVIQAVVVLPLLLKWKKVSPIQTARGMFPALSVAFFTKSSSAAMPMAIKCAQERLGISKKVSGFSFPLCTTINMNACAAFILTTVLFVSMSNGYTYSPVELVGWVFIATLAAIGNAGVPMGCYFLSSAILASMNVPLQILGVILPFYALIDMLESAINVWSDSCVTAVVHAEVSGESLEIATASSSETVPSLVN